MLHLKKLKKIQTVKLDGVAYLQLAPPTSALPASLKEMSINCKLCTKIALDRLLSVPQASCITVERLTRSGSLRKQAKVVSPIKVFFPSSLMSCFDATRNVVPATKAKLLAVLQMASEWTKNISYM